MNILEVLPYSGPLPLEDLLWKSDGRPDKALEQVLAMSARGLVVVNGIAVDKLRDLLRTVQGHPKGDVSANLRSIHEALAPTSPFVELTSKGLRAAPAPVA